VQAALLAIVGQEGRMSEQQAEGYLETLRQQNRYQRDVY
jgi:sulfite reductase (NADPH) flavoprotein alpha-component